MAGGLSVVDDEKEVFNQVHTTFTTQVIHLWWFEKGDRGLRRNSCLKEDGGLKKDGCL